MYPALVALLLFLAAPAIAAPSIEEEVTRAELEVRQLLNEDHDQERSRLHDDISWTQQPMALLLTFKRTAGMSQSVLGGQTALL